MMRTLVLGANGQLGRTLCKKLGKAAIGLTREKLDITDRDAVLMAFSEIRPDVVINAAAYTNVDAAESDVELCNQVNIEGTRNLAEAASAMDSVFVQVSSDYVFDGERDRTTGHKEGDPTSPQGVYAKSKLASEDVAFQANADKCFVIRTCGLYANDEDSVTFKNFPNTILRLAASLPELKVVSDQFCTPSYVPHVADAILALAFTTEYGLYHVTNQGSASWHEFATELLRMAGLGTPVKTISTEEFGAVAARPAFSVLDTVKYRSLGLSELPSWQQALQEYMSHRSHSAKRLSTST